jgi:hypothetical protein
MRRYFKLNRRTSRPRGTSPVCVERLENRQLLSSTVAYWRFENGAANTAASGNGSILDSSGHGFNGTPVNGPTYSPAVPAATVPQTGASNTRSMNFNGLSTRIAIPDNPAFALTRSLTIEAYFDARATVPNVDSPQYILFRGDDRGGLDPYWLAVEKSTSDQVFLSFEICPDSGAPIILAAPITLGTWHEAAGTLNDATGKLALYLDGQVVASTYTDTRPMGALSGANPGLGIGDLQSAVQPQDFNGLIDEVRISNVALSPNQFLNASRPPTLASLSASPNSATIGSKITLTANGVTGAVTSANFYRESNGKAGLQTGSGGDTLVGKDTSAAGGWSTSIATTGMAAGTYTYYAQVTDNRGATTKAAAVKVTLKAASPAPRITFSPAAQPANSMFADDTNVLSSFDSSSYVIDAIRLTFKVHAAGEGTGGT